MRKTLKTSLRNFLRWLVGEKYVDTCYRWLFDYRFLRKYGGMTRFNLSLEGVVVVFSTEDYGSKRCFFPRYEGGKMHEESVTRLLAQQLKSARCFVDVGAHLGYYTCIASKLMSQGVVYAFEMDEFTYARLEKNLKLNGCKNAHTFHIAVADTPGVVSYVRSGISGKENRLLSGAPETRIRELVSVQATTLDEFFCDRDPIPDLIKIDVEGAEMKVLAGMSGILERSGPRLFVEVHPSKLLNFQSSAEEVVQTLLDQDYCVYKVGKHSEFDPRRLDVGSCLQCNTVLYAERE